MGDFQKTSVLHNGAIVVDVETAKWGDQAFAQDLFHLALVRKPLKTVERRPGVGHVRLAMDVEQIVFIRPGDVEHVHQDNLEHDDRVSLAALLFRENLLSDMFGNLDLDGLRDIQDPIAAALLKVAVQMDEKSDPLFVDHVAMALACRIRGLKQPEAVKSKGRIERAMAYANERLDQPLTLAQLASAASMSAFHFVRSFREVTGVTPLAYVMNRRIDKSKALMSRVGLAMGAIAHMCGFSSQSHFSAAFKARTGHTPNAYRKMVTGKLASIGALLMLAFNSVDDQVIVDAIFAIAS